MKFYEVKLTLSQNDTVIHLQHIEEGLPFMLVEYDSKKPFYEKVGINVTSLDSIDITNKKIFRYPKLTLPRNKVDLLKEKYGLKVVREQKDCDYKVISETFVESLFSAKYRDVVKAGQLTAYLSKHSSHVTYATLAELSKLDPNDYVTLNSSFGWSYNKTKAREIADDIPHESTGSKWTIMDVNLFKDLVNSNNLILDVELSSKCNEDSVTLTENDYESVLSMIQSQDPVNHAMALELMANCNQEESFDIIALLFYNYYNILRYATNWNTVNVKSLRKRFANFSNPSNVGWSNVRFYNEFLYSLAKENKLTEFAFKTMSKQMMEETMNKLGFGPGSVFDFNISDIKLKPEFLAKMKRRYDPQSFGNDVLELFDTEEQTTLF